MVRIYKRTDRIAVKIGDITVRLAPLSLDQKTQIQQALLAGSRDGDLKELTRGISLNIKYAVKGVEGLVNSDDQPYQLQFENDELTDECVSDLMNMELGQKLTLVCAQFAKGVPKSFKDEKGNPLDGVELVNTSSPKDEPKKS